MPGEYALGTGAVGRLETKRSDFFDSTRATINDGANGQQKSPEKGPPYAVTERLGAVAYRHLGARAVLNGTGDGDSLQNIITNPLNDGCLCYVVVEKAYYLLDRRSTAAPVAGFIVQPLAGPGRWILVFAGSFATQFSAETLLNVVAWGNPVVPSAPVGTWTAGNIFPPPPVAYSATLPANGIFTADLSSGVLTYHGPPRLFEIEVSANLAAPNGDDIGITADVSGDRIGSDQPFAEQALISATGTANLFVLAAERIILLSDLDTIQVAYQNQNEADPDGGIEVNGQHLVVTPFE